MPAISADPPKPVLTLSGHADPVYAVAVSADGRRAATGSFDKTIKLWDLPAGKEVRTLSGPNGHQGLVLSVAFSPDGSRLASGGADNAAKLWDPVAGTVAATLAHPNLVDAVGFDKTGKLLATACHDGVVRVWDVVKGQAVKQINAHTQPQPNPVYAVIWTPGGKQVVSASFDRSIKVWDAGSGNLTREIKPGSDRPPLPPVVGVVGPGVFGSAAGSALTASSFPGHHDQVFALAVSKDGTLLASGSSDRTVKLWNIATGTLVRDFPNPSLKPTVAGITHPSHPGFVHAVRFTADGKRLVSAGTAPRSQGYLAVWSVAGGKLLAGWELPIGPIHAVELLPDGAVLLGCGPKDRGVSVSDAIVVRLPGGR